MNGPFSGLRILDMTSVVMGPYATQWLGDFGADVVKIEPPDGDVMRQSGPMRNEGMGHLYLSTNRNKRSIVIDLKQDSGRVALLELVKTADALVYNVRPQAMERLGLGYEDVCAVNPSIVYVGGFGFSQRGPYSDRPAYDDLIQGMSGLPSLSVEAGAAEPQYAPMILADRMVGMQLAFSISAALFHRLRTGQGQKVDVPMFEGMASIVLGEHLAGKQFKPAIGPAGYSRSLTPQRRPYRTKDGYLCTLIYNDKQWRSFFEVIGKPEVMAEDTRFSTQGARLANIDAVYGYLRETLATRTTDEWLAVFERADLPAARLYRVEDLIEDEHLCQVGLLRDYEHPTEGILASVSNPTEWSESPPSVRRHAPTLGEHTREIFREIGIPDDRIEQWLREGVLGSPGNRV